MIMKLILASASLGRKYLLDKLKLDYETVHTNLDEEKFIADTPVNTILLRARLKGESAAVLLAVSNKLPKSLKSPATYNLKPITYLILSADTEVILENNLFGKPASEKEAVQMLQLLSGKTHEVVSGYFLLKIDISTGRSSMQFSKIAYGKFEPTFTRENNNEILKRVQDDNAASQCRYIASKKIASASAGKKTSWQGFDVSLVTFRKLTDNDIKRYLKYTDYTRFTGGYALVASPQDFVTKVEGSISNVIGLPMEKVIPILDKYFTL